MNKYKAFVGAIMCRAALYFIVGLVVLMSVQWANAQIAPGTAASPQVLNLMPGQTYQGTLRMRNVSDEPRVATLSQRDIIYEATGRSFVDVNSDVRSNAAWLELQLGDITFEGEEIRDVPFAVTVPADAEPGSYWSQVVITNDPVAQGNLPVEGGEGASVGFQTITRYGILIATNVAADSVGDIAFTNPSLQQTDAIILSVDLVNPSDAVKLAEVSVDVTSDIGESAAQVEFSKVALIPMVYEYPNTVNFNLGRLEPGRYVATIVADTGGSDGVFGVRYNLEINPPQTPEESTEDAPAGEDSGD
jgi:hypothetical protein